MLTEQDIIRAFRIGYGHQEDAPFITRFRDLGGLIFGTGETIAEYWQAHRMRLLAEYIIEQTAPVPPDQSLADFTPYVYEDYQEQLRRLAREQGASIEARSNTLIQFTTSDRLTVQTPNYRYNNFNMRLEGRSVDQERQEFFDRFNASGYRMMNVDDGKARSGMEKNRQGTGTNRNYDVISLRQFMVRRACKYLIYDELAQRNGYIHYALDGIVMTDVVARSHRPLAGNPPKVPVCTSELREIFRMWNLLNSRVSFYSSLRDVPAPWNSPVNAELQGWALYAENRVTKLLGKPNCMDQAGFRNALLDIQRLRAGNDFRGAIDRYHQIPSALLPMRFLPVD